MEKAESFLSNNMNRLSLTLDFEEEYRPIDLNFGLTMVALTFINIRKIMRIFIYMRWEVVRIGFLVILPCF